MAAGEDHRSTGEHQTARLIHETKTKPTPSRRCQLSSWGRQRRPGRDPQAGRERRHRQTISHVPYTPITVAPGSARGPCRRSATLANPMVKRPPRQSGDLEPAKSQRLRKLIGCVEVVARAGEVSSVARRRRAGRDHAAGQECARHPSGPGDRVGGVWRGSTATRIEMLRVSRSCEASFWCDGVAALEEESHCRCSP